jgi:hypothetical protein
MPANKITGIISGGIAAMALVITVRGAARRERFPPACRERSQISASGTLQRPQPG